jgi:hypothetical protein
MVLGTQDLQHHVFHLCFAISSEEETERGYIIIFSSFKNTLMTLFNLDYTPNYVISDGKGTIFSSISKVFGQDLEHLMCFKHFKDSVKRQYA